MIESFAARSQDWAETLARIGYAARGAVYVIIGAFAVLAALGSGKNTVDSKGALRSVLNAPFGDILLAIVALGLFCFALWRVAQGFFDADHLGNGRKALFRRTAYAGSALIYVALSLTAARLIMGSDRSSGDKAAQDWTAFIMSQPFGRWLVAIGGICIGAAGIAMALRGWKADFQRELRLDHKTRSWVVPMGQFGFYARGAVFLLIGGFITLAALHENAREAKGLSGALRALQDQPYGWVLLAVVAVGLFAFGAFQFVAAVYRRISPPSLDQASQALRSI